VQQEQSSLQSFGRLRLALLTLAALSLAAAAAPARAAGGLLLRPAPDFALPAAGGSNVRLSEYRGQPVVLSFWSSRCGRCAAQLAALDRYYATYHSSGLVVFGVSVEDDPQRALDYAHAHQASFPLLLDDTKGVSRAFDIAMLPTTVLIDRSGVVRYLHSDDRPDDPSYVAQIRALLDDRLAPP
jgi:peroxiredoxin